MPDLIKQRTSEGSRLFKRGMHIFSAGDIKLRMGDYLVRGKLPIVPKAGYGHLAAAKPPGPNGWGVLGNDLYGDCVMAGAAHESMIWAWATRRSIPDFTANIVVNQYMKLSGGQDVGLDPVETAKWRQQFGIVDMAGFAHKIDAFLQVDSIEMLEMAVYLFGVAGMCWTLPDSAESQFSRSEPWDDVTAQPDLEEGHYTPLGGRNSAGLFEYITWGRIQGATEAYTRKFMAPGGCIAYASKEYMLSTGKSPEAIAWDDLLHDMHSLNQRHV